MLAGFRESHPVVGFYRLLILIMCFTPLSTAFAEGNEGPHGGDYISSEFVQRGNQVLHALQTIAANQPLLSETQRSTLAFAILNTPISSVETPLFDHAGNQVDALTINSATSPTGKEVHLQRQRWERLLTNQARVHHLVFHEYLWVIGADDSVYRISSRLTMTPPEAAVVAGRSWGMSISENGLRAGTYFYFDPNGDFEQVIAGSQDDHPFDVRGMSSKGRYEVRDNEIRLTKLSSSCPKTRAELGFVTGEASLHLEGDRLRVDSSLGVISNVLNPNVAFLQGSGGLVRWGCLSPAGTFSQYNPDNSTPVTLIPLIPAQARAQTSAGKYQSIAYSFMTGEHAAVWNWPNQQESWNTSTLRCGQADCRVVGWAYNACLAFAVSDSQSKGWDAWNVVQATAENDALSGCRARYGNDCRLIATSCPVP